MRFSFVKLILTVTVLFISSAFAMNDLSVADSLFEHRNDSFNPATLSADSALVNQCITLYHQVILCSPDAEQKKQALWKLLQAFFFKGLFTTKDIQLRRRIYSMAIEIAERYQNQFPHSVEINCWLGILWGYWGEVHGQNGGCSKGVPNKVRYFSERTIALDETYPWMAADIACWAGAILKFLKISAFLKLAIQKKGAGNAGKSQCHRTP